MKHNILFGTQGVSKLYYIILGTRFEYQNKKYYTDRYPKIVYYQVFYGYRYTIRYS